MGVAAGREGEDAGEAGAVEDERAGGDARRFGLAVEIVVKEILDALVDRAEVAGEGAVLFAADREEVVDERGEAVGGASGQGDAGLADFAELEIEVGVELRVGLGGGGRSGGSGHGKRRGSREAVAE